MYLSFAFVVFWSIMIIYQLWIIADNMFDDNFNEFFKSILNALQMSDKEFYFVCIITVLLFFLIGIVRMFIKTGSAEIEEKFSTNKTVDDSKNKRTFIVRKKWFDN